MFLQGERGGQRNGRFPQVQIPKKHEEDRYSDPERSRVQREMESDVVESVILLGALKDVAD